MIHLGCYQLTVPQSLAWHSADEDEQRAVREEIRAACRRALAGHVEESMVVRDADGRLLERVARE